MAWPLVGPVCTTNGSNGVCLPRMASKGLLPRMSGILSFSRLMSKGNSDSAGGLLSAQVTRSDKGASVRSQRSNMVKVSLR